MKLTMQEPITAVAGMLLVSLEHEQRVRAGLGMIPDIADFQGMDQRRVDETLRQARDLAQVRIAGIIAMLVFHGAEIER